MANIPMANHEKTILTALVLVPRNDNSRVEQNTVQNLLADEGIASIKLTDDRVGALWASQVKTAIEDADFIIAIVDLSNLDFNLIYELGYASALRKRIYILTTRQEAILSEASSDSDELDMSPVDTSVSDELDMPPVDTNDLTDQDALPVNLSCSSYLPFSNHEELSGIVREEIVPQVKQVTALIMMPPSLVEQKLRNVLKDEGIEVRSMDSTQTWPQGITDIEHVIKHVDFVVADLSFQNANVIHAVGFTHALDKQCFLLVNWNANRDLPSDLISYRPRFYRNTDDIELFVKGWMIP